MRISFIQCVPVMAIPYGLCLAVHGAPEKKRKKWELVIFEDSTMRTCASADILQQVQSKISLAARQTHCSFVREGVLSLTSTREVCARALEQNIRRWCDGSILGTLTWHVFLPGKVKLVTGEKIPTPTIEVSLPQILPSTQRKGFDREGYVIFRNLIDAGLCKSAMDDVLAYVRNGVREEFGVIIRGSDFTPLLNISPQEWAMSSYKGHQYSKAFCPSLGGGDFLRTKAIVQNRLLVEIQAMLKPFVSAIALEKQEHLERVDEGASIKASNFPEGEDHLDLSRTILQVIVCLSATGEIRIWPGSHKLNLAPKRGTSHKFGTLKSNPHWVKALKKHNLKRVDLKVNRGDVFFMHAGRLVHGIPPGGSSVTVKTFARFDRI